jgi:hypothetical protein
MFSMTTASELTWMENAAKNCDVVVEYGPWLGRSTVALLHGLSGTGELHVYDDFIWERYMNRPYLRKKVEPKYKPGDSFLEEFERNLGLPLPNVHVHVGDIKNMVWEHGEIDFLMIDAYKQADVVKANLPEVFPHVKVGGIVADQDFFYDPHHNWYMYVAMWRLREFFEPHEKVEPGSLLSFRKVKEVTWEQCRMAVENMSMEEGLEVAEAFQ